MSERNCIERIRETGKFAAFVPAWTVQIYTNTINDHSSICGLNDDDYSFSFITTYVQKDSVFLDRINKFIALSIEPGMTDKALRNTVFVPEPIRETAGLSDGYFVFILSHLLIAFYILFFGHGLSFLLFLCEVFYHSRLRYV